MTIYVTPLKPSDALSVDSGFESLAEVVETLGTPEKMPTPRMVFYSDAVFSNFAFRLDTVDVKA